MGITCLVTIHGIGFQQPPDGIHPGYADGLHQHLAAELGPLLSDDPNRERSEPGEAGVIYVSSQWPPGTGGTEPGVMRLGSWDRAHPGRVQTEGAPLVQPGRSISHVALVYARLEDLGPDLESAVEEGARALLALRHYEPLRQLLGSLYGDVGSLLGGAHGVPAPAGNRPRFDAERRDPGLVNRVLHPVRSAPPGGLLGTVRQLEDDVAAYVARNDLRHRVRAFAADCVLRLSARDDVSAIVLNGHSQGTVLAYDTLRDLPPEDAVKVTALVTSGSPLRKYLDLFSWGNEVGSIAGRPWVSFYDRHDPVADPLAMRNPVEVADAGDPATRFEAVDPATGAPAPVPIEDVLVDNLAHSAPGGLQAHNYWDNTVEVVPRLAEILRTAAAAGASPRRRRTRIQPGPVRT